MLALFAEYELGRIICKDVVEIEETPSNCHTGFQFRLPNFNGASLYASRSPDDFLFKMVDALNIGYASW